jgi:hypothetical protein
MMNKKNNLSVRPVRRNNKPGYPSWQEPSQLEHHYAKPYPFRQKALSWLAASGLLWVLVLPPMMGTTPVSTCHMLKLIEADTLKNPFVWDRMGFPFYTSECGYGSPMRINEQEARALIDGAFRKEGLKLANTMVQTGSGYVEATGMDKAAGIGYVWLGYNNLDMDVSLHNDFELKGFNDEKLITYKPILENRLNSFRSIKGLYGYYYSWQSNTKSAIYQVFMQRLKTMLDSNEPDWKEAYKWMFYEYQLKMALEYADKSHLNPHIKNFIAKTLSMKEGVKRQKRMETASFFSSIPFYMNDKDVLNALAKAAKSKTPRLNMSRVITIWYGMNSFKSSPQFDEKAATLKRAVKKGEKAWKQAASLAMQWRDEQTIGNDEIKDLLNAKDGVYIVPISFHDAVLTYQTTEERLKKAEDSYREQMMKVYAHCDSLASDTLLQKQEPTYWERCQKMSPSERSELEATIKTIREVNGTSKEQALRNLEKHVLDYIRWAKQQRGY